MTVPMTAALHYGCNSPRKRIPALPANDLKRMANVHLKWAEDALEQGKADEADHHFGAADRLMADARATRRIARFFDAVPA